MSKIDDYITKREKQLKGHDAELEKTKLGRLYQKNIQKYKEYKKEDGELTEEQKKALKEYYIKQTILILIAIGLVVFLIVRIIQINS